jgi:hypothetical protein
MSGLIKMVATWFVHHLTSDVLFGFGKLGSIRPRRFSNILALGIFSTVVLLTFPVINAVLGLAVNRVSYLVGVACHLT